MDRSGGVVTNKNGYEWGKVEMTGWESRNRSRN